MRRLTLLAVLLIAVLTLDACGSAGVAPAARVDQTEITQESLDQELEAIGDNEVYQQSIEEGTGLSLRGLGTGTYDSSFVANLLTTRIYYAMLEQGLRELGGEVTDADRELGTAQLDEQFGDTGVLEKLPKAYRDLLAHQNAVLAAGQRLLDEQVPSGQAFYNEFPEKFEQVCLSHILVENDDPKTAKDGAQALARRIQAGETFAAVAAAESDDTANAPEGGDLGCNQQGVFADTFEDAAWDAPVGVVVGPVETEFGSHLILVRSRSRQTYEEASASIEDLRQQELTDRLSDLLFRAACDPDHIEVNSRYGSWDLSHCDSRSELPTVLPPRVTPAAGSGG